MRKEDTDNLELNLAQFTGTAHWYKHLSGMLYTDGVEYVAEHAGAYWWIDLVGSYQYGKVAKMPFQVWTLTVDLEKQTAVATMKEDSHTPVLIRQEIEFTDFPLAKFECWVCDGTMLLKSEY